MYDPDFKDSSKSFSATSDINKSSNCNKYHNGKQLYQCIIMCICTGSQFKIINSLLKDTVFIYSPMGTALGHNKY